MISFTIPTGDNTLLKETIAERKIGRVRTGPGTGELPHPYRLAENPSLDRWIRLDRYLHPGRSFCPGDHSPRG